MTPEDPSRTPGAWELQRSMDLIREDLKTIRSEVNGRLDQMATKAEVRELFSGEQRRVDDRMAALGTDIVEEKTDRIAGLAAEKQAREEAVAEIKAGQDKIIGRTWAFLTTALLPIAFFVVDIIVRSK
jgi:hypothetical protein